MRPAALTSAHGAAGARAARPFAPPPPPTTARAARPLAPPTTPTARPVAAALGAALSVRSVLVRASAGDRSPSPAPRPYPSFEEEHDVSHEAFMRAFTSAHPVAASVPGLQAFAAALLDRRRSIPSAAYPDPLDHVFTEADGDSDGFLSAAEVSRALTSRGVEASPEIVGRYIRCARDAAGLPAPPGDAADETIGRKEFAAFVLAMASADLHHHGPAGAK